MFKRKLMSSASFGFVSILIFSVLSTFLISAIPKKVYAAPQGYNLICVPPTTLDNGVGFRPDGWLSLEILNRAQIKITVNPTGNCSNQNRTMDSLLGESPGKTKAVLEEIVMDVNISDDTWGYRSFVDGFSGDGVRDQTYFDSFDEGQLNAAVRDSFGGHDAFVANIASVFAGVSDKTQLVFGIEPGAFSNLIGNTEASGIAAVTNLKCDDGGNISLFDTNGYIWDCTSRTADRKGLISGGTFKDISNFNIIYTASSDGTNLMHVSKNLESSRSFRWCASENFNQPGGQKGRFRTDCANTNSGLYLEGPNANPESITKQASSNGIEVTVREEGNSSAGYKVLVAGSASGSAKASNAGGAGSSLGGVDGDVEPTCETNGGLSWVICPIINGLTSMSQGIFENVIQPYLKSAPLSSENTDDNVTFKIWSSFRTFGNIVLLFALLFVVFGQAIGGGLIDAYTAKKMMPRILLVAVLINLSYYLVAIMVDMTNIIGAGIGTLITAPLRNNDSYGFTAASGTAGNVTGVVGASALAIWIFSKINNPATPGNGWAPPTLGTQNIGNAAGSSNVAATTGGSFMPFFLLFVLLPVALITISIFATLIIRRGLIMFLVIIAPIALALYCLPQTEKYTKKWFDGLVKTLMVYPIVVAIFSIAYVLALMIMSSSGGLEDGTFAQFLAKIVGLIVLFVPLAMIPFAFKLAGGAIASLYGAFNGFGKKGSEMLKGDARNENSLRNRAKYNASERFTRQRAAIAHRGRAREPQTGRKATMFERLADMGNVDNKLSGFNAAASKRKDELVSTGSDDLIYAGGGWEENGMFYNSKHKRIGEQEYRKGKQLYGTGIGAVGQALEYRLRKAQNDTDVGTFREAFGKNAIANNWTQGEADSVWAAATYPHKDKFATEWYSSPTVAKDASGRTQSVSYSDVSNDPGNYGRLINDVHKTRESFRYGSLRDVEWRAMADNVTKFEHVLDTGGTYTPAELENYAMTKEVLNAAGTKMGQGGLNPDGEISVNGPSAASQPIIKDVMAKSKYEVSVNSTNNDLRDVNRVVTTPPPAGAPLGARPTTTLTPVTSTSVTGDHARSAIPHIVS